MGKFVLEDGERLLLQEMAEVRHEGKAVPNAVVAITDRRLVLQVAKPSVFDGVARSLLGMLAHKMGPTGDRRVTHEIRRDDFEQLEVDGKQLVFHSRGEGYAHVSFAIRSMTAAADWQLRIDRWLAGTFDAAPLPVAKLRE